MKHDPHFRPGLFWEIAQRETRKRTAWAKLQPNPTMPWLRIDHEGYVLKWEEYGQETYFGWELDHALPLAAGGADADYNIRARYWWANRSAGGRLGNALASASKAPFSGNSLRPAPAPFTANALVPMASPFTANALSTATLPFSTTRKSL